MHSFAQLCNLNFNFLSNIWQNFAKKFVNFDQKNEIAELCKGVHCVDLGESFQTHIFLQNLASIQPRSSPVKFALERPTGRRVGAHGPSPLPAGHALRGLAVCLARQARTSAGAGPSPRRARPRPRARWTTPCAPAATKKYLTNQLTERSSQACPLSFDFTRSISE